MTKKINKESLSEKILRQNKSAFFKNQTLVLTFRVVKICSQYHITTLADNIFELSYTEENEYEAISFDTS